MSDTYESVRLGGTERNVEYLGVFVAWLVSNNLLGIELERSASSSISRLKIQDLSGPEFLTTVLDGELKPEHLNEAGRHFSEHYFVSGRYQSDYATCNIEGDNDWIHYDEVSPKITAAYQEYKEPKPMLARITARILKFPGRSR